MGLAEEIMDAPKFVDPNRSTQETIGPWQDEHEAMRDFDARIKRSELFRVYKEVNGWLQQPRVGAEKKDMKIDRILLPTAKLLNIGWKYGAVGIEGKEP